jgi:23S rRNA (uracil1939-C5)-methyltransferase
LRVGATLEVTIERILPGGLGLAHAEGQTLLVSLAAPGDHLRVRVERMRAGLAFASITEIIRPSPVRVEPPCPYFGRCGGCDFQQLSYEAQLSAKVEIIRDCLRRIARLEAPADIPITPSPLDWRYRSRAEWQHDPLNHRLGYFERGTHRVCDVAECPVLVPSLQETLHTLRERMRERRLPLDVEEFQAVAGEQERAALAPPLDKDETMETARTIGAYRYRFSADGFFQINQELLAPLIEEAVDQAHGHTAIDLYCGAGLFTLPLATRFTHVTGVESNPSAIAYARRNLDDAGLFNAATVCARVSEWLKENAEQRHAPVDYLLLDPPRTGAEEGAIPGILSLRPRRIAYVSCDPATLARDLKELVAGGYTLDRFAAFDMFPQTHHVETVVHLGEHSPA